MSGIAGLAISIYLTAVHYESIPLACSTGGVVDCGTVTHSLYSLIPATALPITILGVAFFVASVVLALAWSRFPGSKLALAHFAACVPALAYVLWLVYVELVVIHRICEWCSAVHVIVIATFLLSLRRLQLS